MGAAALLAAGCGGGGGRQRAPVPVILDTDMGNDVDDAVALAMLHALETRGEVRLVAVTVSKDSDCAAPFVDAMDTFYGRPDIPIGVTTDGKTPGDPDVICVPAHRVDGEGKLLYPHDLLHREDAPEATAVLRDALQAEADGSVVVVEVGFHTNLAKLLVREEDRALVGRKVRLLALSGGRFPSGAAEYNVMNDVPAAQTVFSSWPTPILVSGFEVGLEILLPATSIEQDYSYVEWHPLVDAFRNYQAWNETTHVLESFPYDRPMWDPAVTLYAARPDGAFFSTSDPGTIAVDDAGVTHFTPGAGGAHRYVVVNEVQRRDTLDAIVDLARQP
jgi:inosine-uridine nucleoside N-ribohydrolase